MTVDELRGLGVNVDEGLSRCLNDEGFYLMLIPDALKKERYEDLDRKIKSKDLKGAFETAHALKGILANLALTPLYGPVSEITELLRADADIDYSPQLDRMWKVYSDFEKLNPPEA